MIDGDRLEIGQTQRVCLRVDVATAAQRRCKQVRRLWWPWWRTLPTPNCTNVPAPGVVGEHDGDGCARSQRPATGGTRLWLDWQARCELCERRCHLLGVGVAVTRHCWPRWWR